MSEQHIEQLHSESAADRRAAIIALARAKDSAAIPALAVVCRTDPDLDLRLLATQAIRAIEQHARAAQPAATAPKPPIITPLPGRTSKRNAALGKFYLTAATNYHMVRDRARTLENLGKALEHDDTLAHTPYVENLVEQVLDLDYDAAIALLSDETRLADYIAQIGGKQQLKRRQLSGTGIEFATWPRVRLEIGAMWLAAFTGVALLIFLAAAPLQTVFASYTYHTTARIAEHLADLRAISILLRLGLAALAGTVFTLSVLLTGVLVHFAAIYAHAGEGTLVYFTRQIVRLHSGALIVGVSTVLFMMLLDDPALCLTMLSLVGVVEIVIYVVLYSILIGEVYLCGAGNGCGTLFIAGVAISGLSVAIAFVLVRVLGLRP